MKNILIIGAGAIGSSLVSACKPRYPVAEIFVASRNISHINNHFNSFQLDPLNERSWEELAQFIAQTTPHLDLIISTLGMLHTPQQNPEKKIQDLNMRSMIDSFQINTVTAALALKHLERFTSNNSQTIMAFLSAKVGSIADNQLGGWYSYRASKAALNMLLKTAAIEFSRKRRNCILFPVHPGTTKSNLSAPFLASSSHAAKDPHQTAEHLLDIIDRATHRHHGQFLNWDETHLPW